MLPCNVTVEAAPEGGSLARIANPEMMLQVGTLQENPNLLEVAREARAAWKAWLALCSSVRRNCPPRERI